MQEERNIISMLIVSLLLLWISWPTSVNLLFGGILRNLPVYNLPPNYTAIEVAWYFVNRIHVLTLILTTTFATLYTSNFGRKQLFYKLSIYLFIVSMISIFIAFAQMLIGLPYR